MANLNKDEILKGTNGGLKLFQILVPKLKMSFGKNEANVDSPISKGKNCFSVYEWTGGKYLFKDHYTKVHGDIFELVALMNKLNSKRDFKQVLEIINEILVDNFSRFEEDQKKRYLNPNTQEELVLITEDGSLPFIDKYFMPLMPYLERKPLYRLKLVEEFKYAGDDGKRINYKFDFSKPKEAFYALTIEEGQYYLLFNPNTRDSYQWGKQPEFYVPGKEYLFTIAFSQYVNLRDTIVLTNTVEGLLFLQQLSVPCIALLNGETGFDPFIELIILPMFPKRFLLLDLIKKRGQEQMDFFQNNYSFEFIKTWESYLFKFLRDKENAIDKILTNFQFQNDFEHQGLESPIVDISQIHE